MAKTLNAAAVDLREGFGEGPAWGAPIHRLQRLGTDVNHVGEYGVAFALAFSSCHQSRRIEFVGDEKRSRTNDQLALARRT